MRDGSARAAVLRLTLSAPASIGGRGIIFRTNPAADAQRQEDFAGDRLDGVGARAASLECRRDVEDDDLVDAFAVVSRRESCRISGLRSPSKLTP